MKVPFFLMAVALLLSAPLAAAWDLDFTDNAVPRTSSLRSEVTLERPPDEIRKAIEKLIPPGTPEAAARKLMALHMPKQARARRQIDLPKDIKVPDRAQDVPYICYRLIDSTSLRPVGRQWIEALFFFEDGKLKRVHVGLGSAVL